MSTDYRLGSGEPSCEHVCKLPALPGWRRPRRTAMVVTFRLGEGSGPPSFDLTPRQRDLIEALGHRRLLVDFYLGARHVLRDVANPDHLAQAAHSVRELIEKLPYHFDVPTARGTGTLTQEINNVRPFWIRAKENSACHESGRWDGKIDGPLRKVLSKLDKLLEPSKIGLASRTDEMRMFLRKTDPGPHSMPSFIEAARLAQWQRLREYFVAVSHHRIITTIEVFEQHLSEFEEFLLNQLEPSTFANREKIRKIIEEAERDADS
ncbi:hypothetical protein [Prauserella endophytica]|uniref:Uncharacterized protein n=1 Tax=Prauserella endophytica TaxID=1592324 RepID=A0ABY2RWW4_9PSEU|nr:hypothetical protein [Prauserella endophytica]TKG63765.1 hypothetical protein FCN18_29460 [Prauserella endophytica]